jgi:hypothetical protein
MMALGVGGDIPGHTPNHTASRGCWDWAAVRQQLLNIAAATGTGRAPKGIVAGLGTSSCREPQGPATGQGSAAQALPCVSPSPSAGGSGGGAVSSGGPSSAGARQISFSMPLGSFSQSNSTGAGVPTGSPGTATAAPAGPSSSSAAAAAQPSAGLPSVIPGIQPSEVTPLDPPFPLSPSITAVAPEVRASPVTATMHNSC